jgi:hypothetical protein
MKTRAIACFITGCGLAFCPFDLKAQADQIQLTPQQQEMQRKVDDRLKNNPFDFYGIVLDERGKPVSGAKVVVLVQGELGSAQGSTEHDLQSDQDGLFKLEGVHSFGVIVTVSKDGYYTLPAKHNGPWFWIIRDSGMPPKDNPAIFPLQKKGATEPLVVLKTGSVNVPPDGTILDFNLERCRVIKGQPGTFEVQMWVDAHDPKASQPYHWKFRITVPGGGIQPRASEYDFSAPSSGYKEFIETEVTPGIPGWNDSRDEDCFVKLADGKYAQIRLTVRALGDFFITQGYLNPSGSQNLEFDPAKRIKP